MRKRILSKQKLLTWLVKSLRTILEGNIDGPECCLKTEFIDDSKEYDDKELYDIEMLDMF